MATFPVPPRFELRRLREYSDEAVLSEIRRVATLVGEPRLTRAAFQEVSRVGMSTICRRFGTWANALQAASLAHLAQASAPATKSRTVARGMTDEEVLAEMRRVAAHLCVDALSVDDF